MARGRCYAQLSAAPDDQLAPPAALVNRRNPILAITRSRSDSSDIYARGRVCNRLAGLIIVSAASPQILSGAIGRLICNGVRGGAVRACAVDWLLGGCASAAAMGCRVGARCRAERRREHERRRFYGAAATRRIVCRQSGSYHHGHRWRWNARSSAAAEPGKDRACAAPSRRWRRTCASPSI